MTKKVATIMIYDNNPDLDIGNKINKPRILNVGDNDLFILLMTKDSFITSDYYQI